jgi:hypothetical protein
MMLESVARMAYLTVSINPHSDIAKTLHDRHFCVSMARRRITVK